MTSAADTPVPTPLDSEREALRKAGYSDAEVSQILIARAASQQPAGIGQGAMSNVLSSILAVASHTRALIPTFRKDVETVFDGTATASARAGATASLAVKAIVVIVLGYAAWQEWRQHIIYATQIAESQARKIRAEECSARLQALGASEPLNRGRESPAALQFRKDCDSTYTAAPQIAHASDDLQPEPGQDLMTFYRQRLTDAGVPADQIEGRAMEYCLSKHDAKSCVNLPWLRQQLRAAMPASVSDSDVDRDLKAACEKKWGASACLP